MRYTPANTAGVGRPVRVLLDGEPVAQALQADDAEGWVDVRLLGPNGRPYLTPEKTIATARLTGKVTVEWVKRAKAGG